MICAECPATIHPERLAARPNAITCSAECTKKRQKNHRKRSSIKANRKKRRRLAQALDLD